MTLIDFLMLLLVAGIAGALGQALAGNERGGCLLSVVIGFIGSLIGLWMARLLGLPPVFVLSFGGTTFPVVWAVLGSAALMAVLALFRRRSSKS